MNALKRALIAGMVSFVALAPAKADMLRHAQVVAANEADYKANIQLIPTFNAMLKKSPGLKAVYVASGEAATNRDMRRIKVPQSAPSSRHPRESGDPRQQLITRFRGDDENGGLGRNRWSQLEAVPDSNSASLAVNLRLRLDLRRIEVHAQSRQRRQRELAMLAA